VCVIEFCSVTKRYADGNAAVDNLDLVAPNGKITVLVGPSGCGKTTSLRMINRMIEPTSGRILVDGEDTSKANLVKLRLGIGYVIQQAGLFPHRTVLDNIATVPDLLGWDRKRSRAVAAELLERVGLPENFAGRYPVQLSGGQQQRVGVARALAADPPVLLMDEPFSAVDPIVRASLQDEFLRLQGELGKTIVFVTHDIDEAIKLGDFVAILRAGGRLAQLAPPQELLAEPADDFVADFVGRDRGIRGLSFLPSSGLPIDREPVVVEGSSLAAARHASAGSALLLVVDEAGRPLGWLDGALAGNGAAGNGAAGSGAAGSGAAGDEAGTVPAGDLLRLGGTVPHDSSMRRALDLALTSPAGRAVAVDDDGVVVGTVTHEAIARHLADHLHHARTPDSPQARP